MTSGVGRIATPGRLRATAAVALRAPFQPRVPFRSRQRIAARQRRRVRAAVAYAYRHVPYYRETMRRLDLTPADFDSADDLARLPVIERADLQRDPEYFVSEAIPAERCVKLQSGGSTGEPVQVLRDPRSTVEATVHAQRHRALVSHAVGKFRYRQAGITMPSSSGKALGRAFLRLSLLSPQVRLKRLRLSMLEPPSAHIAALNQFKPDAIGSYGSYIEALFVYLEATGTPCHLPKAVSYAADSLSDSARQLITERFGISVLSTYQSIESGQVGFECEEHRGFHVNVDFCPVRIVDRDGRTVPDGESGDVVTSDLTNRATVLLNYRLGDVARSTPDPCPCGRTFPMISFLEGRVVEWIRSASGRLVHPQSAKALLRKEADVRRYQIVQRRPEHFEVALVAAPGCARAEVVRRLEHGFAEQFGSGTTIDVQFVDDLPRTAGGKVRAVVSLPGGTPGERPSEL